MQDRVRSLQAKHPAVQRLLSIVGFVPRRFESRFRLNVRAGDSNAREWFLKAGDIDSGMHAQHAAGAARRTGADQ